MSKHLLTRKTSAILICSVLILILSGWYFINKFYLDNKHLIYTQAIDKVYNSNLDGISVIICKSTDLHGKDANPYNIATGSKNDNFSANSQNGVKLWSAKQLFLNAKTLKILKKGMPEILQEKQKDFYVIQTYYDYLDDDENKIRGLNMFINRDNYHIFIPKEYHEPIDLINSSVEYIEYEPNEITKNLTDDLIKIK